MIWPVFPDHCRAGFQDSTSKWSSVWPVVTIAATMKISLLLLSLLSLLGAILEVRSEGTVKLCGREFIRAVIYTCGGSRWKRHLDLGLEDVLGERSPLFPRSNDREDSGETWEDWILQPNVESGPDPDFRPGAAGRPWGPLSHTSQERRDLKTPLTTSCCQKGCRKTDLSSLC
ncbi:insulin-like peptide INSL5 [Tachyglossus aculeatus]|uniref:insulin-like peptide INSL5 n=1 Tax=Tachyglossus aculeatus TaxID=9261 RepID=UPI0018F3E91F|nr:insulin-like peptide INSL5 [Tachyglossus aculeatus]